MNGCVSDGRKPAVADLTRICDYLDQHDGTTAARRIALAICEGLESLTEFPRKGRPGRKPGTRELVFPRLPWLAVYRIHDDLIVIVRILHGAQRYPWQARVNPPCESCCGSSVPDTSQPGPAATAVKSNNGTLGISGSWRRRNGGGNGSDNVHTG